MASGPGIPGWFIAIFIVVALLGDGGTIWRISMARKIAQDAGLDPSTATKVSLFSKDGLDAAYIAAAVASARPHPDAPAAPRTAEQRLVELQALRDKGLVSEQEFAARRQEILGSI